jgi:membrane fusion protein, heavy metal efflux system
MTREKSNRLRWVVITATVGAVIAAAVFSLRKPQDASDEAAAPAASSTGRVAFLMEQQWLIKLKLAQVQEAELAPQLRSTGRIVPVPAKHAVVAPAVGGIIQSGLLPRVGQQVRQGQDLATLIQTPTAAEAAQIHIENTRVEAERRRLEQFEIEAKARLDAATHDLERSQRLYAKKAYSAKALEADQLDRTAATTQLQAVRDQLNTLKSAAPPNSAYEVRAPISGTIVAVNKSSGEQVAPGQPMFEIAALDTVWLEAPIFEKDLGRVGANGRAVFTTAAFPDKEFQARLIDLNKVVDEKSRAAMAIFEVANPTGELRLGMQANVRLNAGPPGAVLLIPKESVLENEGKKIVYVLISGEEFERRNVVVGDEYGSKVAIVSGLKSGERVVTQGAYQLKLQELRPADAGAHTHET